MIVFILDQISCPGGAYKKAHNFIFQSSKDEEITLSYEFIFVFISNFTGRYSQKLLWQFCEIHQ